MKKISFCKFIIYAFILLLFLPFTVKAASNPFNALVVTIGLTNESGSVKYGEEAWYKFTVPKGIGNVWIIARLTGAESSGVMEIDLMDEHLNAIKGGYTQSSNHICELVCRMECVFSGTRDENIPRLLEEQTYYIRISGTGSYNLNVDSYADDYYGDYDNATVLSTSASITGMLERDDDIDAFSFKPGSGKNYMISVYATKKMNAYISDADDYTLDNNSLSVMRDMSTSECVITGDGNICYFFLSGTGGTKYNIKIAATTKKPQKDKNILGTWTKVTHCDKGRKFFYIKTLKGAKLNITSNKKILKGAGKVKKSKNLTAKTNKVKVTLSRKLRKGDTIRVIATKERYKKYVFKVKIK